MPAAAKATGADLHHVPYFAPPLVPRLPTVVTVHDLVPLLQPAYRRTAAQRLYTALACLGLRRAAIIVTDSRASADDLERRLQVPADKIRVVPLAVDPRFRPLDPDEEEQATSVLARHGLNGPYFLYLGGFDHRKNLATLVVAFARLCRSGAGPHRLALAGPLRPGDEFFYDPCPDLERLGIAEAVVLIDRPDDAAARVLYARANAFVFPSRYEGFGLPPLEAMACGAPVICSRASSLPEVVGDAALLFDPDDVDSLTASLTRVAANPDLRRDLSARGRQRAARFTWEATAAATVEVYREVIEGR